MSLKYEPSSEPLHISVEWLVVKPETRKQALPIAAPPPPLEREFFIDNLLVQMHLIIEMILVDRPCAMGV